MEKGSMVGLGVCLAGLDEHRSRCLPSQRLPWATVELGRDGIELVLGPFSEITTLRQILPQQAHQEINFRLGTPPVLHRKRVKSERWNVQARAGFDDHSRGFHSRAMPGHARQVPPLRPAAVAVHDDGDMAGQPLRVEAFEQASLFAAGRFK